LAEQEPSSLLIAAIRRRLKQVVFVRVREHGLSPQQFWVLQRIAEHPGSSLRALADGLHMDGPTASRVVNALVRQKLVRMEADPEDRRRGKLVLSASGRSLASRLAHVAAEVRGAVEAGLSAGERGALRTLLRKALANVERMEA
jgi:DNA-binding MarR family transcriptional regulator